MNIAVKQKTCFANERTVEGAYQTFLAGVGAQLAYPSMVETALVPECIEGT